MVSQRCGACGVHRKVDRLAFLHRLTLGLGRNGWRKICAGDRIEYALDFGVAQSAIENLNIVHQSAEPVIVARRAALPAECERPGGLRHVDAAVRAVQRTIHIDRPCSGIVAKRDMMPLACRIPGRGLDSDLQVPACGESAVGVPVDSPIPLGVRWTLHYHRTESTDHARIHPRHHREGVRRREIKRRRERHAHVVINAV